MKQVFHPASNSIAKSLIVIVVLGLLGLGLIVSIFVRSPFMRQIGVAPEQPAAFSHEHHVGGLGLDCRYCHLNVEESSFAGIPSTDICMGCHSKIWNDSPALAPVVASYENDEPLVWNRVNRLADYAFFNHSIHINKGIGCETCHGRVDQMPLSRKVSTLAMEWCLECHRNRADYVRPREEVFTMGWEPSEDWKAQQPLLVEQYHVDVEQFEITDCSICHR
ncbi:MAG TPA: cytochrome c3 family protein [Caldilineae bacterium]|nr:cytochrome c3 family protein [Caldilineae bacterium]